MPVLRQVLVYAMYCTSRKSTGKLLYFLPYRKITVIVHGWKNRNTLTGQRLYHLNEEFLRDGQYRTYELATLYRRVAQRSVISRTTLSICRLHPETHPAMEYRASIDRGHVVRATGSLVSAILFSSRCGTAAQQVVCPV